MVGFFFVLLIIAHLFLLSRSLRVFLEEFEFGEKHLLNFILNTLKYLIWIWDES